MMQSNDDWESFWNNKAKSPGDFQATGRGGMDVIGFLYTMGEVVRLLQLAPEDRLLDVGCGTGLLMLSIAPWVKHIHGVDISTNMVERAQGNLSAIDNVSLATGTIIDTCESDAHYDKVLAYSVLQYLPDEEAVLQAMKEVGRVLVPGGRALLAANPDPARRHLLERKIRQRADQEAAEREIKLIDKTLWLSPQKLIELAAEAGLKGSAEPISGRIWQHFYMFDLTMTKNG